MAWQLVTVCAQQEIGREPLSRAELASLEITMSDFEAAVRKVQPSVRREGFATTPDVTWDDVGALREVQHPNMLVQWLSIVVLTDQKYPV